MLICAVLRVRVIAETTELKPKVVKTVVTTYSQLAAAEPSAPSSRKGCGQSWHEAIIWILVIGELSDMGLLKNIVEKHSRFLISVTCGAWVCGTQSVCCERC